MIIDDLDVKRTALFETEADSPLIVDAYTPCPVAIATQLFQAISGWRSHIFEPTRQVQLDQFPQRRTLDGGPAANRLTLKQSLRVWTAEALDHRVR
jgi:hypothetical protein